jgi:hypothetical protein
MKTMLKLKDIALILPMIFSASTRHLLARGPSDDYTAPSSHMDMDWEALLKVLQFEGLVEL